MKDVHLDLGITVKFGDLSNGKVMEVYVDGIHAVDGDSVGSNDNNNNKDCDGSGIGWSVEEKEFNDVVESCSQKHPAITRLLVESGVLKRNKSELFTMLVNAMSTIQELQYAGMNISSSDDQLIDINKYLSSRYTGGNI